MQFARAGYQDLKLGFRRWELWTTLGWNDLKRRYRRSAIGPFWTVLSLAIFVGALGGLYSNLFNQDPVTYVPHLTAGMVLWNLIFGVMTDSCRAYSFGESYLKQIKLPISTFPLLLLWRNLVVALYQFVLFILIVVLFSKVPPISAWLYAILGLLTVVINCLWLTLLISIVSARYHDFGELLANVLRIVFFLTPIIWIPGEIGRYEVILDFNPFFHLIEIVRSYMLGSQPSVVSWIVAVVLMISGGAFALVFFGKHKDKVCFWI